MFSLGNVTTYVLTREGQNPFKKRVESLFHCCQIANMCHTIRGNYLERSLGLWMNWGNQDLEHPVDERKGLRSST